MTLTYRLWGYRLNRLDEPVFMAVPKSILTEFDIHYRLESCVGQLIHRLPKMQTSFWLLETRPVVVEDSPSPTTEDEAVEISAFDDGAAAVVATLPV